MDRSDQSKRILFDKQKYAALNKRDLSNKGSIDVAIRPLVDILNDYPTCYTTSTCSGRITLIDKPHGVTNLKKNSKILLNQHCEIDATQINDVLSKRSSRFAYNGNKINSSPTLSMQDDSCVWLKFEPFILHIQTYDLTTAKELLRVAIDCGCRNSGMTFSSRERFLVAVRSTSTMEVPLSFGNQFQIEGSQLKFITDECNTRMCDNSFRLLKFQNAIETRLSKLSGRTSNNDISTSVRSKIKVNEQVEDDID